MKKLLLLFTLLLPMVIWAQQINVSPETLSGFSYIENENEGPSEESTFVVLAWGLNDSVPTSITVRSDEYFEISTVSNENFGKSLVLEVDSTGTVKPTTIYVRMVEGLSAGTYTEDIVLSSTAAPTVTVQCNGQVIMPVLPTIVSRITAPLPICAGNSLQLVEPEVSTADLKAWQISPDSSFSIFSVYTDQILDESYNNWYIRYMASNEWGTTYSDNIVPITIYPSINETELDAIVGKKCGFDTERLLIYPHSGLQYQWYKDNEPIAGATEQYYYPNDGLKKGFYWVEISKERDGDGQLLCPISSPEYEVKTLVSSVQGMVHPNPSQVSEHLYITREDVGEAMLTLYSIDGRLLYSQLLVQGQNTINFNLPRGIFIATVTDSQGEMKTEKIIIQ